MKAFNHHKKLGLIFVMNIFFGCAQDPEDPGLCSLNCSAAIIAPGDTEYSIVAKTADFSDKAVTCYQDDQGDLYTGPIVFHFLAVKTWIDAGGDEQIMPIPNVAFEPEIIGAVNELATNPENAQRYTAGSTLPDGTPVTSTSYHPFRYRGIATPKSNWCSDSCGVMAVEVVPSCPAPGDENPIGVSVHSGALFSDQISGTVTSPAVND